MYLYNGSKENRVALGCILGAKNTTTYMYKELLSGDRLNLIRQATNVEPLNINVHVNFCLHK